jgi:hypothetical protein
MSTRVMPFRGSLTSREQVSVYEFSWAAIVFVPLVAVLIQIFIPVKVRFMPIVDLPFMVTIFFATARRNPITGCLTGCVIGLDAGFVRGAGAKPSLRNVRHCPDRHGIPGIVVGSEDRRRQSGLALPDYLRILRRSPGRVLRCGT